MGEELLRLETIMPSMVAEVAPVTATVVSGTELLLARLLPKYPLLPAVFLLLLMLLVLLLLLLLLLRKATDVLAGGHVVVGEPPDEDDEDDEFRNGGRPVTALPAG